MAKRAFGLLRWFKAVAEAHNQVGLPVRWVAPSGFEAIEDYRKVDTDPAHRDRLKLLVDGPPGGGPEYMNLGVRVYTEELLARKQTTSLAANVVHSLDAALLVEIVAGSGIDTWGVIHDAFAVPANRVWELLNRDNPRAMRALYVPDRLAEWLTSWSARDGVPTGVRTGRLAESLRQLMGDRDGRGPLPEEMLQGLRALG